MKKNNDTKDYPRYSEQLEFLNSEPYYASKKIVNQSSDFPVRRTGSYRHKKALPIPNNPNPDTNSVFSNPTLIPNSIPNFQPKPLTLTLTPITRTVLINSNPITVNSNLDERLDARHIVLSGGRCLMGAYDRSQAASMPCGQTQTCGCNGRGCIRDADQTRPRNRKFFLLHTCPHRKPPSRTSAPS